MNRSFAQVLPEASNKQTARIFRSRALRSRGSRQENAMEEVGSVGPRCCPSFHVEIRTRPAVLADGDNSNNHALTSKLRAVAA
jgi:hypothetical protein